MSPSSETPPTRAALLAKIEAGRASIAALRDEAREYGRMPFKVRDMHVMLLHRLLAALAAPEAPAGQSCVEHLAAWMIAHGIATGHGDTLEDLLAALDVHLAPAGQSCGALATYRIEEGRICHGCANCEPLGECNDADGCDGTGFVPTQMAPMVHVTPDERAELHELIVSFHAVTDPEEHPDLCARAFAVTEQCDNVGHCVPHKQPPSSLAAPEDAEQGDAERRAMEAEKQRALWVERFEHFAADYADGSVSIGYSVSPEQAGQLARLLKDKAMTTDKQPEDAGATAALSEEQVAQLVDESMPGSWEWLALRELQQRRAQPEALREVLDGIASPLAIDGENHMAAVYHARRVLGLSTLQPSPPLAPSLSAETVEALRVPNDVPHSPYWTGWNDAVERIVTLYRERERQPQEVFDPLHAPSAAEVEALRPSRDLDYEPPEVCVRNDAYEDALDAVLALYRGEAPQQETP